MADKMRSTLKLLGFVIILLVVTTVVSYFVAKNVLGEYSTKQPERELVTYDLGEYLTNLADRGYVKVSIVCLLDGKETEKEVAKKEFEVKDRIYAILRSKTYDSVKDSKGMGILKNQIKAAVNELIDSGEIEEVFFTEIIVN
ncbi:MAG: flagellar basal body-associated FliL family protein [Bacillota bacterium]